jgi:hypothetical protein
MAGDYSTEQLATRRTRFGGDMARIDNFIDCRFEESSDLFRGNIGMVWKHPSAGAFLAHVHCRRTRTAWDSRVICNR